MQGCCVDGLDSSCFPIPLVFFPSFWRLFQAHQLHFLSPSLFQLSGKVQVIVILFAIVRMTKTWISWSVFIPKFQRIYVSFSRTDSGLCTYHLLDWSYLNLLNNSWWTTFPTQSCLLVHLFCVSLLHALITWRIASYPSPHNLHLILCCLESIFTFIILVHMASFFFAMKKDKISRLRFPLLSHVQVIIIYGVCTAEQHI